MTMNQLALHIISIANEHNMSITNLQLQKIMYFSVQRALKDNLLSEQTITETYNEPFMVWRYGPVVKSIYEHFNIYGGNPIIDNGEQTNLYQPLNDEIVDLLRKNPFELVNKSHAENFWINHKNQIKGWRSQVPYTINDLRNESSNVK